MTDSLPLARHRCERCHRSFAAKRSDARFCSHRCQRQVDPPVVETPVALETAVSNGDEDGWRRLPGGFVAPPADPRNTFFVDPDQLRRL